MVEKKKLIERIQSLRLNPAGIQRVVLEALEEEGVEKTIVDATNPFTFLVESAAAMTSAALMESEAQERRLYPANAQTHEELFHHMSDVDYIGIFASPSSASFSIMLSKDEVLAAAVPYGSFGGRKLTIARNTAITVAETTFTMQYPIDILVTPHNGIEIIYNTSKTSPLRTLSTNQVRWEIRRFNNQEFIRIIVPVDQMKLTSHTVPVDRSTGFKREYEFQDQYYFCRVYTRRNNVWNELKTTHTEQVYDNNTPTAVLKVVENKLHVMIPEIYFTQNDIGGTVRVDVYTTKGDINVNLANFEPSAFAANFIDLDNDDNGRYVSAFKSLSTIAIFSEKTAVGGSNGLTFEELRERVITNTVGDVNIPITNAQLDKRVEAKGYELVKKVDSITNRRYLATRTSPAPVNDDDGVAPILTTMKTLQTTIQALSGVSTARVNIANTRATLLPSTLYRNTNNVIEIVPQTQIESILNKNVEDRVVDINKDNFLYTPFYYVFDISDNFFETRVYDMDNPSIDSKFFVAENETSGVQVSAISYTLRPADDHTGYYLDILTASNDLYKAIGMDDPERLSLQISFVPENMTGRACMTAKPVMNGDLPLTDANGEFVFRFHIQTDYEIDAGDNLTLKSFFYINDNEVVVNTPLVNELDLVFVVDDLFIDGLVNTDIDNIVASQYLNEDADNHVGVAHERMTVQFGHRLNNLWTRSRTIIGEQEYERYENDILLTYEAPVYERDSNGNIVFTWDEEEEELVYNVLHKAGEPVIENTTVNEDTEAAESGQNILTFTDGSFTEDNVGDAFIFTGAGADGEDLYGRILSVESGTSITLDTDILTDTDAGNKFIYGSPTFKHRAGDVKVDEEGKPKLIVTPRELLRQSDIFLMDGKYYFATSPTTLEYRDDVVVTIRDWIINDLEEISQTLHERTWLHFYPKTMTGTVRCVGGEGTEFLLEASQSVTVTLHVPSDVYENLDLRGSMDKTVMEIINSELDKKTVSYSNLISKILATLGDNVMSVDIDGLFGDTDHTVVSVKDLSNRFSIGKEAVALPDGNVAVRDSIGIVHVRHDG